MAFNNFYIQTTGNDVNAGSSTSDTADVTQTNGSWTNATHIYLAASGTPFAATNVGDWASIYVDGATLAVYIAQVTTINAAGASITLSSTAILGTAPTTSATARSCKINGAWASPLPLASGGFGAVTVAVSTKVNIKSGTYNLAADTTFSIAGTAVIPFWVDGYNSTPGDLDKDTTNSLAKPIIAMASTHQLTTSGNYVLWSNISITGNVGAVLWSVSVAQYTKFIRMRCVNSSSSASAQAMTAFSGSFTNWHYCYFKCPTTATSGAVVIPGIGTMIGCVVENGGKAAFSTSSSPTYFIGCVALNPTGNGWLYNGVLNIYMMNCTVVGSSSHAVSITVTPATGDNHITACLFSTITGWGINNSSGTIISNLTRICNTYYSCSSGDETGFGDQTDFFRLDESANPITSTFSILASSKAYNGGFPGVFENESVVNYLSAGAVVPKSAGGGGYGGIFGS